MAAEPSQATPRRATSQRGGVTGRILEPASGTGRVLIPLLEAGFAAEGLDTSPEMLAVCRQHCRGRGLDLVARAQATSRKAARKRRAALERELAGYTTAAERCDLEAALDRHPDGVTHELRSILIRQSLVAQETRFPAIGRS